MSDAKKDTVRAQVAGRAIIDGRDIISDQSLIMVTLEHAIAAVLLTLYRDPTLAAGMLNEGLVQGVEDRISLYRSKQSV